MLGLTWQASVRSIGARDERQYDNGQNAEESGCPSNGEKKSHEPNLFPVTRTRAASLSSIYMANGLRLDQSARGFLQRSGFQLTDKVRSISRRSMRDESAIGALLKLAGSLANGRLPFAELRLRVLNDGD